MKITFVGTSHGVPTKERFCSCIMLESGGNIYFIDAGVSIIDSMVRSDKDVSKLKAVFTTHAHGDHIYGVVPIVSLINCRYKSETTDFFITEQPLIDSIKQMIFASGSDSFDDDRVHLSLAHEGIVYSDENIKVEYIPTKHSKRVRSYAILVTEGKKRVLFGGDFSSRLHEADIPKIIEENINGFVCEMAHFGIEHITPYLKKCRAKRVFFTHVSPSSKYDDIECIKSKYPFEILTPNDNDNFEI